MLEVKPGRRLDLVRFVVYGAGAVGGVLGGLLAGAGYPVVLIARGAHLDAIRRDGLRVLTPDGEWTHRLPTAAGPHEVDWRPDDVVLLAVKSMDTEAALRALAAHADPGTAVVCVQNGVANERAALRLFENVYGVCVMFPTTHLTPGVVVANSAPVPGILDIGRYPTGSTRPPPRWPRRSEPRRSRPTAAGHHALEVRQAADEPRQRGRGGARPDRRARGAGAPAARRGRGGAARGRYRVRVGGGGHGGGAGPSCGYGRSPASRAPAARPGRAWPGAPVPSRPTTSTARSCCLGRVHGVPTPDNERVRQLANQYARERRRPPEGGAT